MSRIATKPAALLIISYIACFGNTAIADEDFHVAKTIEQVGALNLSNKPINIASEQTWVEHDALLKAYRHNHKDATDAELVKSDPEYRKLRNRSLEMRSAIQKVKNNHDAIGKTVDTLMKQWQEEVKQQSNKIRWSVKRFEVKTQREALNMLDSFMFRNTFTNVIEKYIAPTDEDLPGMSMTRLTALRNKIRREYWDDLQIAKEEDPTGYKSTLSWRQYNKIKDAKPSLMLGVGFNREIPNPRQLHAIALAYVHHVHTFVPLMRKRLAEAKKHPPKSFDCSYLETIKAMIQTHYNMGKFTFLYFDSKKPLAPNTIKFFDRLYADATKYEPLVKECDAFADSLIPDSVKQRKAAEEREAAALLEGVE